MVRKCGVILHRHPGGRQEEIIPQGETLFELIPNLCPAISHFALEVERTCQSACPPTTNQPRAADSDQQNDPYTGWVNDLHD
jgi:hypothetical protein